MEAYNIHSDLEEFSAAREHFEFLVEILASDEMHSAEHFDVENVIFKEGYEILRRLLQGHLDLRSKLEPVRESVMGSDCEVRTHRRPDCTRSLESRFGEVKITRIGYSGRGISSLFPLDAALNLPVDKYSHGLSQVLGGEIAKNSFDESTETICKMTGGKIPKRQAEDLSVTMARDFDAFYFIRRLAGSEKTDDLLVMSTDGKGVVVREEYLRTATYKASQREKELGNKKPRLEPGEKRNRKRMATVATVYTVAPNEREPEDIISVLNSSKDKISPEKSPPRPENKRVWASLEKSSKDVINEMFEEAQRRDPEHKREWVVLVDGAEHQMKLIKQAQRKHGVKVTIILDIIHVLEYLWKASYVFFEVGSEQSKKWVSQKALEILNGRAGLVAGGMKRKATMLNIDEDKRKNVDKCANYLNKYKPYLHYDKYLKGGYPIATGVIEGACRYLVKDRMEITGARWGLKNAEAVLKLRAIKTSQDADEYWDFHRGEEFKRNHRSEYSFYPKLKAVK